MNKNQALSRAMSLCSGAEYSEADIRAKLKFWGVDPGDTDAVIEELQREKFIDDLRFAIAFVRDKVRINRWGRVKIRYMLTMAKIKHDIIDQALNEIDEETYLEELKELLHKKARELKNESDPHHKKQKLIRFAHSRGFEVELILKQLKEL